MFCRISRSQSLRFRTLSLHRFPITSRISMSSSSSQPPAATGAQRFGLESQIQRNPHRDFKAVEASREKFESLEFHQTQTNAPSWTPGSGATDDAWKQYETVEVDPYGEGRSPVDNYKLLISGVIPRPIGFVSTLSKDGIANLAPFSYTTIVNHDPPIFCIGFSGGKGNPKDTCKNLLETGECTINMISEWFVEAANYTATNAPHGVSEWALSGLTQAPSTKVAPARVAESAFSIEAKLVTHHEFESPATPGKKTGILCILQGINFHIRSDALNDAKNIIDPKVLRPVSRLGGITYGRTTSGYEMPRPDYDTEMAKEEVKKLVEEKEKN
ncbi:hypothetical protein RUND412_004530 [Rhizina undulata]